MNTTQFKESLRSGRYAAPGYPTFFVMSDGSALCHDCARDNFREIVEAIKSGDIRNGWRVEGHEVNYEDAYLTCDDCGAFIEAAYAERDDEGGEA